MVLLPHWQNVVVVVYRFWLVSCYKFFLHKNYLCMRMCSSESLELLSTAIKLSLFVDFVILWLYQQVFETHLCDLLLSPYRLCCFASDARMLLCSETWDEWNKFLLAFLEYWDIGERAPTHQVNLQKNLVDKMLTNQILCLPQMNWEYMHVCMSDEAVTNTVSFVLLWVVSECCSFVCTEGKVAQVGQTAPDTSQHEAAVLDTAKTAGTGRAQTFNPSPTTANCILDIAASHEYELRLVGGALKELEWAGFW